MAAYVKRVVNVVKQKQLVKGSVIYLALQQCCIWTQPSLFHLTEYEEQNTL